MGDLVGFEPTSDGLKVRCRTGWLQVRDAARGGQPFSFHVKHRLLLS